jgi:hypothetical protein
MAKAMYDDLEPTVLRVLSARHQLSKSVQYDISVLESKLAEKTETVAEPVGAEVQEES